MLSSGVPRKRLCRPRTVTGEVLGGGSSFRSRCATAMRTYPCARDYRHTKEQRLATHDVSFEIPQKFVLAKDVVFDIKSDGSKLGSLLISKGNIEWVPANNSVKKRRLSWEKFAQLMESEGKVARMK